MSERMTVTVSEDNKSIRVVIGNVFSVHREIVIDASDTGSIVSGLIQAANAGDQMVQVQLAQLAQRVEALEKLTDENKATALRRCTTA